jgi:hypothetical protein
MQITQSGAKEVCHSGVYNVDKCTCVPGYTMDADGACQPCQLGGYCCLCIETAGCVSSEFGACDLDALFYNIEHYKSPCKEQQCFSGTDASMAVMPKPGYFICEEDSDVILACNVLASSVESGAKKLDFAEENCLGGPNSKCAPGVAPT